MRIHNLPQFLKTAPQKRPRAVLVVGREAPIVGFYASLIETLFAPCESVNLLDDLKSTRVSLDLFQDMAADPKKNIRIHKVTASQLPKIEQVLKETQEHYIFEAPGVKVKTKLVEHFQNALDLAMCPAYEVSEALLKPVLQQKADDLNIALSLRQLNFLCTHFTEMPGAFFQDLDKLSLLQNPQEKKTLVLSDTELEGLLTPASSKAIDPIIDSFLLRDPAGFLMAAKPSIFEDHDYLLIRSLLNQTMLLSHLVAKKEAGIGFDFAFQNAPRRTFYHKKAFFQNALGKWKSYELFDLITKLLCLEYDYKAKEQHSNLLVQKLLSFLART